MGKNFIFIVLSKELVVGILIFCNSIATETSLPLHLSSSSSSIVFQSSVIQPKNLELQGNLKSLRFSSPAVNSILNLRAGVENSFLNDFLYNNSDDLLYNNSDDLLNSNHIRKPFELENSAEEIKSMEKLKRSVLYKCPNSSYTEISIAKAIKHNLKTIGIRIVHNVATNIAYSVADDISNKILEFLFDKPQRPGSSSIENSFIDYQNPVNKIDKSQWKGLSNIFSKPYTFSSPTSSSIFAEALEIPNISPTREKALAKMRNRNNSLLKLEKNYFSNNLEASGLSSNHNELPENLRSVEELTRLRRAEPLYPSNVLGERYKYSQKQLERKGKRHLEEFGYSLEGKTLKQIGMEYYQFIENILAKPNLIIYPNGQMNKQEPAEIFVDPETQNIVAFESNPLYPDRHFITSYGVVSEDRYIELLKTGKLGMSREERASQKVQEKLAVLENQKKATKALFNSLPPEARITNSQLAEAEKIQQELNNNPNFPLTEKDRNLMDRANNYKNHEIIFEQEGQINDKTEL